MPHYRNRFLTRLIKETLSYSPIVGIFGHRQVGKQQWQSDFQKVIKLWIGETS